MPTQTTDQSASGRPPSSWRFLFSCVLVALVQACSGVDSTLSALSADGATACEAPPPAPPPDWLRETAPLPSGVAVDLIARGVSLPTTARVAFIAPTQGSVHSFGDVAIVPTDRVVAELNDVPEEIFRAYRDSLDAEGFGLPAGAEASLAIQMVVYDDRDGDGRVDLGEFERSVDLWSDASLSADERRAQLDRYEAERAAWEAEYGHLSFAHISNPADPANEVLALAPVTIIVTESGMATPPSVGSTTCVEVQIDAQETCEACRTVPVAAPDVIDVPIEWAL